MGEGKVMRVLIEPGTYDLRNMGDVAMLQMAVRRVRREWPEARVEVLTNDPTALARHCRGARAVPDHGRRMWLAERSLLGGMHDRLPAAVSAAAVRTRQVMRRRSPAVLRALVRMRSARYPAERDAFDAFFDAIRGADLHLLCGQGTLADSGIKHAEAVLRTLEMSRRAGARTAMLGQGVGPISDPRLVALIREVVPEVGFIGLREGRVGPSLLQSLDVRADRMQVTGDEAVELAYEQRPATLGDGLGINIRVAANAGVARDAIAVLARVVRPFLAARRTHARPLPIAHGTVRDADAIAGVLDDADHARTGKTGGVQLDSPEGVVAAAGGCRVVVTGAYHAAVFALAQGVSVVCLSGSPYYADKFLGLRALFGEGCRIVWLDRDAWERDLSRELADAWDAAADHREALLHAAEQQVDWGREVFAQVASLVRAGS